MPFREVEIRPGMIAWFDVEALNNDRQVIQPASPPTRVGPFVCVEKVGGRSVWTEFTHVYSADRLLIDQSWIVNRPKAWGADETYLNDGRTTYVGPDRSFVDAASAQDTYQGTTSRPYLNRDGVAAVIREIRLRGGQLLAPPTEGDPLAEEAIAQSDRGQGEGSDREQPANGGSAAQQ